jgi:hypothetical protein
MDKLKENDSRQYVCDDCVHDCKQKTTGCSSWKGSYTREELESKLKPIAEKFDLHDCPKDTDIVHVILPWLDDANDCIEVYIIRDKDGNITMSFD